MRDNGGATSSPAVVSITVESVNDAPAAADDTVVLEEDVPHAINVLGNDSDIEGNLDASSVEVVAGPASGTTVVDPATGVITYTPGEDFNGDDLFRYRVRDEDGLWSNDAAVRLTVEPVNDAPLANDDDAATDEDVSVRILVLDNDDDVEGRLNPSSVAIVRAPTLGAATVEHDGSITYTPDADTSGTDEFTYTVADDEGALSNEATVTVSIRAVNDAPTISGTPPAVVDVGEAYEFTPVIDDVEGDPLTVSAENLPAWLSLDPDTGALRGTPTEAHVGDYPGIVLRVGDGSATTALAAFSIQVRGEPDSDADGMPDDYELEHGFDPLDPSDAAADADGDGVSNRDELDAGTNPLEDDYAPEISAADVVEIDAVGLLTPFPALAAPSAVDGRDGNVQPVLEGDAAYLPPGLHRVVWAATDAAGNRAEIEQLIKVHPQISLAPDEVRAEGSTAEVRFILNGPSPSYPLTVAFNVDGTASLGADHDLYPGTITFEEGELEKRVPVAIAADAVPEGAETIEIALVGPGNLGPHRTQTVTIIEQNAAPRVSLALAQDGRLARIVTAEGGQVLVYAFVDDPNPGDTHTFEWWFPKGAVTASVADGVEALDPSSLPPGIHELRVVVRDSGVPALETEIVESFRVVETPPEVAADDDSDGDGLDDEAEGFGDVDDDGSPDYLDGRHRPNVLAERIGDGGDFLIETEPGLRLMLGSVAQLRGGAGAGLSAEDMTAAGIGPDSITNVGGHVDFVVRDIPTAGASVAVVIPQRQPIPENPVYRKHDGIWFTLVEDARNRLASAPGERGVCPPPGSGEYRPGLNAGDWCVELTIEDGGPNDTDGLANGMIRDPGGVGTLGRVSPPPPPPPSVGGGRSGGGGAFGLAGLLGLLGVATLRRRWGGFSRTSAGTQSRSIRRIRAVRRPRASCRSPRTCNLAAPSSS